MSFIYTSQNTFTFALVILTISCFLAPIDRVDCHSLRKRQEEAGNEQQRYNELVDSLRASHLNEAEIGPSIRSAKAGEEASQSSALEPRRKRSKRLQMMVKDESEQSSMLDGQSSQLEQEERAKQVLRKRWHKLADDLIDDVFANQQQQPQNTKSLDSSYKKKKWLTKQQEKNSDNGYEKIMILMKKPLSEPSSDNSYDSITSNDDNNNQNNLLLTSPPQQQQQMSGLPALNSIQRPNIKMQEHARRILDDKFGIMKESIFTTNNHLGLKGVPKFGSDEEY